MSDSQVFLVPTPIGNLQDLTYRAVQVLKEVDFILAEDTRNSAKLLNFYEIDTKMYAYHMHNEHYKTEAYLNRVKNGETLAIISDGGTPGISDPGYVLVNACIQNNIPFETLPGATAFVPALINSGFPNHEFLFMGFLPPKKGRQSKLKDLAKEKRTIILYESPHKVEKLIGQLLDHLPAETPISISREISKKFEETIRGNLASVWDRLKEKPIKGELVIVINNAE